MKEYPTVDELKEIREWDIFHKGAIDLLRYIEEIWHNGDLSITGKKVIYVQMHTFGWSGNEEIIAALKDNRWFWTFYWQASKRGGHYWFKIDTRKVK